MVNVDIPSSNSKMLSDVQSGLRTVLYEEMAEYYYLFMRKDSLKKSSVDREIGYHITNIVMLTLYFDIVFIQTSSIFNTQDLFIRKVARGVLESNKFREMIENNVVRIIGWGGPSPKEMFQAAHNFSIQANKDCNDEDYFSVVASIFKPESVVSRSLVTPDFGMEELFKKRLEQTTIIRNPKEHHLIEGAVDRSLENSGQFVAVSFNPELGRLKLDSVSLSAVGTSFIQSWHDNLAKEMPNVIVYAPMTSINFLDFKNWNENKQVQTFLFCPRIFAAFLRGYLSSADFNKILKQPYKKLVQVKNGDWKRFCDAYHDAICQVSDNIGQLVYIELTDEEFINNDKWANELMNIISKEASRIDVNAFLESLAMLSGVILSTPFLGPTVSMFVHLSGKKLSDLFQTFRTNASNKTSPFIQKLIRHYELVGT